ncbi:MAG: hypothetical protein PUG15_03205, partial [Bacteroidales bacterium]|nr:hypothetical protein [Bacteroidales bacterium]
MKHTFKPLLWAFSCLLSLSPFLGAQAQTPCSDRLMQETDFTNINDLSATRWSINDIESNGLTFDDAAYSYKANGNFSNVGIHNNDPKNQNREYAIVKNPNTLSSQYANIPTDGMLVINPKQGEDDQYLMWTIADLIPGNTYYLEMKVWNVIDWDGNKTCNYNDNGNWVSYCNWNQELYIDVQANQAGAEHSNQTNRRWQGTNGNGEWSQGTNQVNNILKVASGGAYAIVTGEFKMPSNASQLQMTLRKGAANMVVLGVDYIRIKGCQEEKIQTSTGSTKVCEYDPLKLTAQGLGPANGTYTWRKNGAVIAGATGKTISIEGPANGNSDTYQATGEYASKTITITGASCCSSADKVEVFNEKFPLQGTEYYGQFYDLPAGGSVSNVYTFAGNNPDPSASCAGYQYALRGAQYAVVDVLNKGGWWPCWDNATSQPVKYSHTNDGTGFMIVNANGNAGGDNDYFYRRTLDAVCDNTTYEFSAYIASIQNGPGEGGVEVKFNIYQGDNLIEQSDPISLGNLSGWVQAKVLFTTGTGSNYNVRVVNNKSGDNGNDLVLDDIVVSKCLMKVNALDDEGNMESEVCSENPVRITATLPGGADMSTKFNGATPYYIWQRSTNGTTWTNIGGKTTNKYYDAIPTATKTYYRAKIGTAATIDGDIQYNTCAADTYTEPYSLLKNGNLNVTATAAPDAICAGAQLKVNGSVTGASNPTYSWKYSANGNWDNATDLAGTAQTFTKNNATTADDGTYYFVVTDNGCEAHASAAVTVNATPAAPTVTNADPACAGETMKFSASGVNGATYTWTGSFTGDGDSQSVTAVSGQTYSGTVKATLNGCESATANYEATAKTTPTIEVRNLQCSADLLTYTGEVVVSAGTPSVVSGVGASITGTTFKGDKDQNAVVKVTADGCSSADYDVTAPNCDCDPIDAPVDASADHEYCSDKTVPTLSVTANLGANEQVEWFESADCSGTAISTNKDFTPNATQAPAAGTSKSYYVRVRNTTTNCKSDVTTVTLKNNQAPTVTVQPAAAVCFPNTIDISTTPSGANTYKYYSDA